MKKLSAIGIVLTTSAIFAATVAGCGRSVAEFKVWSDQVTATPITYGSGLEDSSSGWHSLPWKASASITDDTAEYEVDVDPHMEGIVHCSITIDGKTESSTSDGHAYDGCVVRMSVNDAQ